jgi:hypothetical protein
MSVCHKLQGKSTKEKRFRGFAPDRILFGVPASELEEAALPHRHAILAIACIACAIGGRRLHKYIQRKIQTTKQNTTQHHKTKQNKAKQNKMCACGQRSVVVPRTPHEVWRGDERILRGNSERSFGVLSLRLSRACLGKLIISLYNRTIQVGKETAVVLPGTAP